MYVQQEHRTVSMGNLWALQITTGNNSNTYAAADGSDSGNNSVGVLQHKLLVNIDRYGSCTLFSHRWEPAVAPASTPTPTAVGAAAPAAPLRVLTYNLWHHNPPSWVPEYRNAGQRWRR